MVHILPGRQDAITLYTMPHALGQYVTFSLRRQHDKIVHYHSRNGQSIR